MEPREEGEGAEEEAAQEVEEEDRLVGAKGVGKVEEGGGTKVYPGGGRVVGLGDGIPIRILAHPLWQMLRELRPGLCRAEGVFGTGNRPPGARKMWVVL